MSDALERLKTRLLGGGALGIPPTFLELLVKNQAAEQQEDHLLIDREDYTKGEFRAYWLDGELFRSITFMGERGHASADGFAYPLSTLSSVKTSYSFSYDNFTRRHENWRRVVTLRFRDQEPIVLENVRENSKQSRFVDAVLGSVGSRAR